MSSPYRRTKSRSQQREPSDIFEHCYLLWTVPFEHQQRHADWLHDRRKWQETYNRYTDTHTNRRTFIISLDTLFAPVPRKIKMHDEWRERESRDRRRGYYYTPLPPSLFSRLSTGTRFLLCCRQLSRRITTRIRHKQLCDTSKITLRITRKCKCLHFVRREWNGNVYHSIRMRSFGATGHVIREAVTDWLAVRVTKLRAMRDLCAIYNTNHVKNIRTFTRLPHYLLERIVGYYRELKIKSANNGKIEFKCQGLWQSENNI